MTQSTDSLRPPRPRQVLIIAVVVGGIGFLLVAYSCLFRNSCYLSYDSEITEVGICLEEAVYEFVTTVPDHADHVYLCGRIEGTTPRPGRFHLFRAGTDLPSVYSTDFEEPVGLFFFSLERQKLLEPGEYEVQIGYARETLARTKFSVE